MDGKILGGCGIFFLKKLSKMKKISQKGVVGLTPKTPS